MNWFFYAAMWALLTLTAVAACQGAVPVGFPQ